MNKSWQQHPTRDQLYGQLPPVTKTIQVRRTWHAGHCWRSKDELIIYVLLWTPAYGQAKAGRPARTYIQQLCEDTRCNPEDLPEAMNDREKWWERVKDIRSSGATWWWWWFDRERGIAIHLVTKRYNVLLWPLNAILSAWRCWSDTTLFDVLLLKECYTCRLKSCDQLEKRCCELLSVKRRAQG